MGELRIGVLGGSFRKLGIMLALTGCASTVDKPVMTRFEPMAGGFKLVGKADAAYPENDATAEAQRIRWLEEYLADNRICQTGYEIVERKPILVQTSALTSAKIMDIHYIGRCRR